MVIAGQSQCGYHMVLNIVSTSPASSIRPDVAIHPTRFERATQRTPARPVGLVDSTAVGAAVLGLRCGDMVEESAI